MILTLLVEPIKADLGLTDTQLGLLHGLAFALFYATVGYPLGLLADRFSRKWLITIGVLLWVTSTALSAFARTFATLFLCRMGLGLGEAALSPAAMSLIADYFRPEMRARAASIFITGASIGGALAVIIGGWLVGAVAEGGTVYVPYLGEIRTWQLTFLVVSAPGFLLAGLMMFVREPERRQLVSIERADGLLRYMRHRRGLLALHIGGMTLCSAGTFAFGMWIPTLLIRTLDWSPQSVAYYYGPILMFASVVGMIGGGILADRGVRSGDIARPMKLAFLSMIALLVSSLAVTFFTHSTGPMLICLALFNIVGAAPFGVSLAALLATTPNAYRGQITALYLFGVSFGGFAVGPPVVGAFSDYLFSDADGLANALALLALIAFPGAAFMLGRAVKPYRTAADEMSRLLMSASEKAHA